MAWNASPPWSPISPASSPKALDLKTFEDQFDRRPLASSLEGNPSTSVPASPSCSTRGPRGVESDLKKLGESYAAVHGENLVLGREKLQHMVQISNLNKEIKDKIDNISDILEHNEGLASEVLSLRKSNFSLKKQNETDQFKIRKLEEDSSYGRRNNNDLKKLNVKLQVRLNEALDSVSDMKSSIRSLGSFADRRTRKRSTTRSSRRHRDEIC